MKELSLLEAKNVVGVGLQVEPDFEAPLMDVIFAASLFCLGYYWGPIIMPIMAYKYGYTFLDFKTQEAHQQSNLSVGF